MTGAAKPITAVFLLAFLSSVNIGLYGQDVGTDERSEPPATVAPVEEGPSEEGPVEVEPREEEPEEEVPAQKRSLFDRTLLQDLETAGSSELADWAITLGLSPRGSRREIEDRILEHYGLTRKELLLPEGDGDGDAPPDTDSLSVATIERARGSDYFTIEQTDERYLRLYGGVILTMEDGDSVHTITAQEIVLNLERDTISANGTVEYQVNGTSVEDQFTGESIVFNIRDWDGVFLRGITDSGEPISNEDVDFSVFGERISRSPDEIIVVDNGVITSSQADPPNYRIKARRIWILAPGEWGIRRAVLYVGRVPMFFFPAMFIPGDRLFFNPAIGFRSREGSFIQTTTYIFGESPEDDAPLSIMQIAESPSDKERVIRGLFLTIPDEPKEIEHPNWTLKVMADVYTTLGYYSGIAGTMPGLGPFSNLDFRFGVGTSRNIYNENGVYSSFYVDEMGNARRRWNEGYLLDRNIPFRYESYVDGSVRVRSATASFLLEHYSDTRFPVDYGNRAESIDWEFLLNQTNTEESETPPSDVNSFRWEALLRWNPNIPAIRPWVTSLGISSLRTELQWSSRENAELRDAVTQETSDNSPEDRFFYPESAIFPDLSAQVGGTLFQLPRTARESEESQEDNETDSEIRPPWEPAEEPPSLETGKYRLPERAGDLPGIPPDDTGSIALTYTVRPTLRIDRVTDSQEWVTHSDTGFDWRYSTLQNRNRGSLDLKIDSPGGWVTYAGSLSGEQRYQNVEYLTDLEESEEQKLEEAAYSFTGARVTHSSTTTGYPLRELPLLERSTLQHRLNSRVYERTFEEVDAEGNPSYTTRFGDWSEDGVSQHTGTGTLRWEILDNEQALSAETVLPPLNRAYTGTITVKTGPLTSSLSGGYRDDEEEGWIPDPLVQQHSVTLGDDLFSAEQRLEYNIDETELVQSRSVVNLLPLRLALTGQRTNDTEFVEGTGWVDQEDIGFQWTTFELGIDTNPRFQLWKRRVELGLNGDLSFQADLQKFTQSGLVLDYGIDIDIYRFLTFEFAARSTNDLVYQYVPSFADKIGRPHRNVWEDLADSLRVFDAESRRNSFFKIDSVRLSAVHDLQDWDLTFSYVGSPELVTEDGISSYEWEGVFAVLFQWRAIPEIRRDLRIEEGKLEFVES